MKQTLHDVKNTVKGMADVRSCAKRHPWLTTGSAVVVGFVIGAAATPARGQNIKRPWSRSEREVQPQRQRQTAVQSWTSFVFASMGTALLGILKTVLPGMLAAAVVGQDRDETPSLYDSIESEGD